MVPVHLYLVDCLVGPAVAQFRRSVCRQQEQRHAGHLCLYDRSVELQRCGAGGADQGDRPAAGLGHSQGEKTGAAFVQMQECLDIGVGVKGKRQRCRARAGGDTDRPQPGIGQPGDQCLGEKKIRVGIGRNSAHTGRLPTTELIIG